MVVLTAIAAGVSCSGSPTIPSGVSDSTVENQPLLAFYEQWQDVPYQLGGTDSAGVDCSAFVKAAYAEVYRVSLPRETRDQAKSGVAVSPDRLRTGDLVFFKTGFRDRHVGIFVGNGQFIHASESLGVSRTSLANPYWSKRYWKARRPEID